MKHVVRPAKGGPVRVFDVPRPTTGPTEVLVQTVTSAVSPGTGRAVTKLGPVQPPGQRVRRPDLVRQVLNKAKATVSQRRPVPCAPPRRRRPPPRLLRRWLAWRWTRPWRASLRARWWPPAGLKK